MIFITTLESSIFEIFRRIIELLPWKDQRIVKYREYSRFPCTFITPIHPHFSPIYSDLAWSVR